MAVTFVQLDIFNFLLAVLVPPSCTWGTVPSHFRPTGLPPTGRCGLPPGRLLATWLPLIGRIDQRFDAQDERIERGFDSIGQQISSLDHAIDDRIEAYDYHHHVEDGAVVFSPSPRQK